MKILHVIPLFTASRGGPIVSLSCLCGDLARFGHEVTIMAGKGGPNEEQVDPPKGVRLVTFSFRRFLGLFYSRPMKEHLRLRAREYDIIHSNGMWTLINHFTCAAVRREGAALVVSPRGMLEPWALNNHKTRKRALWTLYQRADLRAACCLHATAREEAYSLRALGLRNPIAVLPNGLDVSNMLNPPSRSGILDGLQIHDKKIVLFMSRIEPKKGLLHLAAAWGCLHRSFPEWRLVIAGPDENGHIREVRSELGRVGGLETASYVGPVYGEEKTALLARCDLFVLPTHSENFGVVIAEALASGRPVITTTGAPWRELNEQRCGWQIDIGAEPLERCLREAMAISDAERQAMGERGRALICENYTSEPLARKMEHVYRWALGHAETPACVIECEQGVSALRATEQRA